MQRNLSGGIRKTGSWSEMEKEGEKENEMQDTDRKNSIIEHFESTLATGNKVNRNKTGGHKKKR